MRNLTAEMAAGIVEGGVLPNLLGVFEFDSGTVGMWTGLGQIDWNGITFSGGGNLIGVSPIEETQELQAKGQVLSLNGISSALLATSLTENVKNRPLRIYLSLTDPNGPDSDGDIFIADPYRVFSGLMDTFEFTDDGEKANIRLSVENILMIGQRAKISRYTDEEQRQRFPDDMGLEFINRLQDREIVW